MLPSKLHQLVNGGTRHVGSYKRRGLTFVNFGDWRYHSGSVWWAQHIFVDCAAWLNSSKLPLPQVLESRETRYFVEYFPPLTIDQVPKPAVLVRPSLLEPVEDLPETEALVFSLGGACTPDEVCVHNPLSRIAEEAIDQLRLSGVSWPCIVAGGGIPTKNSSLVQMCHADHVAAVRRSSLVVASPGLYTVFEALKNHRPLLLLPPTNLTQIIQFDWYSRVGLVKEHLDWIKLLGIEYDLQSPVCERAELAITRDCRRMLAQSTVVADVASRIANEIRAICLSSSDSNGYTTLCDEIINMFDSPELPTIWRAITNEY